jgi:hypothetical protein
MCTMPRLRRRVASDRGFFVTLNLTHRGEVKSLNNEAILEAVL